MPLLTELGLCLARVSTNISLLAELLAASSFGPTSKSTGIAHPLARQYRKPTCLRARRGCRWRLVSDKDFCLADLQFDPGLFGGLLQGSLQHHHWVPADINAAHESLAFLCADRQ